MNAVNRRQFLQITSAAAVGVAVDRARGATPPARRRRGFNLTELVGGRGEPYRESDFAWMAEWGFDFARLPLSYWVWSSPGDWMRINPAAFAPLDQAVAFGRQYGIHLNLCLHRIPGYCVNGREQEPHQLFESPPEEMRRALGAAVHHWRFLAERYRDIPPERLSFDLLNEPPFMTDQSRYVEIARALIAAIREVSPERPIYVDGADLGQTPVMALADAGVVQSTRGYLPKMVSHYTATWVPKREFESFAKPTWPMRDDRGRLWDKAMLRRVLIDPWMPLRHTGAPIHVGEWGCYSHTPHPVCLAWMRDLLSLWQEVGWGWAMWNLRGQFGVVDSGRPDVRYEPFHGHALDRRMLELLRQN